VAYYFWPPCIQTMRKEAY